MKKRYDRMTKKNNLIFKIGNRKIGANQPVFIVAEISANHNQDFDRAKELIKTACQCGADAVKLQTYTPDTLTLNSKEEPFQIKEGLWKGKTLYDLFKQAYMPWEWQPELKKIAESYGVPFFSTAYDETAVEFLEKMDVPAYKIASFEINHLPLIRMIASTGKPIFMSTGMATRQEVGEAVATAHVAGCKDIILLKCTSAYPAKAEDANILTIPDMRQHFNCQVGLSDHTLGIGVAIAAIAHGATVIEKHFTIRRQDGGLDSAFSLEPEEMKTLVKETERARQSLGKPYYGPTEPEKPSLQKRRSLYIIADMKVGDVFTKENLRCIRPSYGLAPKYYNTLLGKRVRQNVKKGTPVSWELVDKFVT